MDDLIQQGVDAFKAGDKESARKLLSQAIKQNPDSERAWGWMYNVCNTEQERIHCLKQIVRINPQNEKANQRINELTVSDFPLESPTPQSTPGYSKLATPAVTSPPKRSKSTNLLLFTGGVILVLCVLCGLLSLPGVGGGKEVKYVVRGSQPSTMVTYFNDGGGLEQVSVSLPFEKTMQVKTGAMLSLAAQNGASGKITCEIWVNGILKKTSTSTASYGLVSCADLVQ
jgi:hypothetical protein